jgi:hypothetical protein
MDVQEEFQELLHLLLMELLLTMEMIMILIG